MEKTSLSHIVRPVTKHLEYVTSSRKRVRYMIEIMKELEGISSDIKMRISSSRRKNLEVPASVNGWLDEVEKIKEDVGRISNMAVGHFNMKLMYQAGRSASEATRRIQKLITEQKSITWTDATSEVTWTDARVPLGRIRSSGVDMFMSRQKPFEDALKFLQQDDNKNQVIALCGMGGVGKTTMMEQLQKVARDKKMFNFIVKVVIGKSPNIFSIQNDLALWLGGEGLRETTITARADTIHKKIKEILDGENRRILVILDDVWEKLELKDIGLTSPLPKGIKVLLTSRSEVVCQQIASAVGSVVQVVSVFVLNETEAQFLFFASSGVSEEYNSDLYHIGCDIVKKCGGLPVAIITVALTLRSEEDRNVWHNTLRRFNKYDNNNSHYNFTHRVFEMSFENLRKDEDKEIFLHCALFPKDYDISLEYLAIYAWGLNLFKNVSTFREARERTKKCVHNLIGVNLLMSSNHLGCVKMHDLLHDFVLNRVSTGGLVWIIKHDDVSYWGSDERSAYCTRISLTCTGLSMVPTEFKYPNLSLLQLMHGDMLEFPEYFHENMENLQVIAYYKLQHPLLPRCSTRLRTLSLHGCTLESDYSFVGDLVNLEVLSFAHCGIRKLPSTIGNLKRLKLLDLTGCVDLQIDDGVFMNLDNLEELYMRVSDRKAIRFTDSNWDEFTILVRRLFALEAEFVEKKTRLENLSFNRLEKFKISIGCLLDEEEDEDDRSSFTNTLKIVTESESENDILDSQINKLFKETHKLHLQVQGVIGLEKNVSLGNLRDLTVSNCAELEYVFPIPVASGLIRLERLIVSSCSSLETLVCSNNGSEINSEGGEVIKFEALKFLCLEKLPELVSLFLVDTVVELPQLVELEVDGLPNFTGISSLLNNQVQLH
ncbi:hypothetical protein SSX86_000008 [Deinandra increscens subsp. villosa]|uniref:NB-ARC domain-containing protein n=1 Tax=Deinandra increscens subsp. villosa TaxID=3103831 RepID=A0AAP0HDM1_9ASTR